MRPQIIPWERISRYIYRPDTLIVDLRSREEYRKGHITGAWNILYDDLEDAIGKMADYERVIFYCAHGNHSLAAARMLAGRGKQAFSVAGGFESGERKRLNL